MLFTPGIIGFLNKEFYYLLCRGTSRKVDGGRGDSSDRSDTDHAHRMLASLDMLRNDDNFCDIELYSGDCLEKHGAIRAHRYHHVPTMSEI